MVVHRTTAVIIFGSPTKFLVVLGLPDYHYFYPWHNGICTECTIEKVMFYLLHECSLVETQHPGQSTVHWSHWDRVDQWPWLAVADKPESRYQMHKTDMGGCLKGPSQKPNHQHYFLFGGPLEWCNKIQSSWVQQHHHMQQPCKSKFVLTFVET